MGMVFAARRSEELGHAPRRAPRSGSPRCSRAPACRPSFPTSRGGLISPPCASIRRGGTRASGSWCCAGSAQADTLPLLPEEILPAAARRPPAPRARQPEGAARGGGLLDAQTATGEIARLEAILGADPGSPAFPALAEANRRAGRLDEAERVAARGPAPPARARRGPRRARARAPRPGPRRRGARRARARARGRARPPARARRARTDGAGAAPEALDALADDELDGAFEEAETVARRAASTRTSWPRARCAPRISTSPRA